MRLLARPVRIEPGATTAAADGAVPGANGGTARANGFAQAGESLLALRADPRQAIEEQTIRCLICGQFFRQLTNTHLRAHDTGPVEYKQRFGYNRGRPLMCHVLHRLYADRAVRSRLAARIRSRPILTEPDLRRLGGSRVIALEEMLTRREARRRPPIPYPGSLLNRPPRGASKHPASPLSPPSPDPRP